MPKDTCINGHKRTPENLCGRTCLTCKRERDRAYKAVRFFRNRTARYGITKEDVEKKLLEQNNQCAICGVLFDDKILPCVDHEHDPTKKFRGMLCRTCNSGLGMFKECVNILEKAIKYLKDNRKTQ